LKITVFQLFFALQKENYALIQMKFSL